MKHLNTIMIVLTVVVIVAQLTFIVCVALAGERCVTYQTEKK